ncbi:hypothetical protein AQJ43_23575 [Streptomyces avermitilis]|uniref:Uncharacterized protein n=2 Tax=Streptomyces avermitilis TaxID=33903 RepID=Q82C05_STRAW|nr:MULTISPECIES: hypothetical protein [Streptomyces]KUN52209.1 hypothetical protein AQJ43_23575 [Streptomyces avermitilis]MYT01129.1 hypothetical protein [Streptomyces sp. SID5469]OOV30742.1 hypothetical protein SM007_16190 [Streptomyces avermitilis]BAC73261.1 hypothetical protein SAVERM_5549 [Streptomyces avermitilis MA-4680 = NBRC 14893]BBJ53709.1 hypothetical protein SAVMC3_63380 [Streptomyces avermitilis]
MTEPIAAGKPESLRRLPWTGPEGSAEYAAPEDGVEQIADRTEAHLIRMARNDAAYALTMAERPEVSRTDLCLLVRKLAGAVGDVASVAELRGERLNEPIYAPAVRALEEALRAALSQR